MKGYFSCALIFLSMASVLPVQAAPRELVYSPKQGVLCDKHTCADSRGVSKKLTEKYLGKQAATKLFSQGDFDLTEFTFMNGIFCDTKERLCRKDRYYGTNNQRSPVSDKYTKMLFGK
ncbi:YcgJ family protein [Phyllobacterium meliloti]|uniref:YcgJ family protein n=1 Tax=Phyllobacterium meliloti TaxID=555317 RepID=UPI001D151E6E|nr:YcgJ family protein [Phyllobacterium sp. T1293]UGX86170.1 YcgJ family protein [Phyllobacterium sp. T1293]